MEYGEHDEMIEGGEDVSVTSDLSDKGKRLDVFLSERLSLTRSAATRLIEDGNVTLRDQEIAKNYKLRVGDTFVVHMPAPTPTEAIPQNIPIDIVYEDADIIVVNKPQGMVVHPAPGNPDGTLVNALMYHCGASLSGIGGVIRPGIVHRIDKDTAGLLVVAKNDDAHLALAADIKAHKVSRIYEAIALGNFKTDCGTLDAPIGRHPVDRKRMAIIRDPSMRSRNAVTHWEVVERFGAFTHIRCELETGRTHQIRVHMASIGHPLLGDPIYGGNGTVFEARHRNHIMGQCLFAAKLRLTHPRTKEAMCFEATRPESFEKILEILRREAEQ